MSLSSKSNLKTNSKRKDYFSALQAEKEIQDYKNYIDSCLELNSWDLSQEEADMFSREREYYRDFKIGTLAN